MPTIPDEVPPIPRSKHQRADKPTVRISKRLMMGIMMDSTRVWSRSGRKIHISVDDKTVCGLTPPFYRVQSDFTAVELSLFKCDRCFHVYESVVRYFGGDREES